MKIKDVWYFNCKQGKEEFLQSDFFSTSSHIGIYCEFTELTFPLTISVCGYCGTSLVFEKNTEIANDGLSGGIYIKAAEKNALIKIGETKDCYPDFIHVSCTSGSQHSELDKKCGYSVISGNVSNFDGKPFPSAVMLYRYGFEDGPYIIGTWTDKCGSYSLKIPNGLYNAVYSDDSSYGSGSLECWGWHFIADRDETVNLKIGSGEVYSLNVFTDNGGINNLFLSFRPMLYYKKDEYEVILGKNKFNVTDIAPELETDDITVTINGKSSRVISLQKIYETADDGFSMPMYIVQVSKPLDCDLTDKQTVILEYDTKDRLEKRAASRGFVQFYYKDGLASAVR